MEKYRQAQEVAKVWVDKLETEPSGDVARLLPEMLRAVAFQTLSTMGEATDPVGSQDLMFLAKALKDVSSASRINVDTELLLRKVRDQAKAAAAEVTKTIKQAGLSDETVRQIRPESWASGRRSEQPAGASDARGDAAGQGHRLQLRHAPVWRAAALSAALGGRHQQGQGLREVAPGGWPRQPMRP
jgi:hypothetical protein